MSPLHAGLFDDFKGDRTLLLWSVDATPLERLLATLGVAADTRRPVTLTDLAWVKSVGGTRLQVSVREPGTLAERKLKGGGVEVNLQLSPEQLRAFADQIASLASPGQAAGHHYFDPPGAKLQIMISKGEYPPGLQPDA